MKTKKFLTAEDRKHLAALREEVIAVKALMQSDGWKIFGDKMQAHEDVAYNAMMTEKSDRLGSIANGAYHAVRSARFWPQLYLKNLESQIQQLTGEGMEE